MKSDKLPILAEIWLRSGEKISTVRFYDNHADKLPSEICNKIAKSIENEIRMQDVVMMNFGSLTIRVADISAIKFTPFEY